MLTTCLLWSAGCQSLYFQGNFHVETRLSEEEIAPTIEALMEDHWLPNPRWSPEQERKHRESTHNSDSNLRWRYASDQLPGTLSAYQSNLISGPALDDWFLLGVAKRKDLAGWNAAILYASINPEGSEELEPILNRLVMDPPSYSPVDPKSSVKQPPRRISISLQAAAAEAWCLVLANSGSDPIDALAPAGKALQNADLPDAVRGELFRGIARYVPPANVPGLDQALPAKRGGKANPVSLRHAAIEACILFAIWNDKANAISENPWPDTLQNWQWEPDAYFEEDPVIRRRFALWLALTGHPNAVKILETQLIDQDPSVRDDALIHLGRLKSEEALATLKEQIKRPEPRVRVMAVKGLSHWGVFYLAEALEDSSHEVRISVAEELGRFPTTEAALQLQKLQADSSRQVETAALHSTKSWPDKLAIPVLLSGMEHGSLATRRECFRELRQRREIRDSFPIAAGPEVRQHAVNGLIQKWDLPAILSPSLEKSESIAKVNRLRVAELHRYLADVVNPEFSANSARHQMALKALKESAAEDVPAIEAFLWNSSASTANAEIIHQVLPALSPVYAALEKMEHLDVNRRRLAANELRSLSDRQSLSALAVNRLRELLKHESDGLVWRASLLAVLPDDNRETTQLVMWAANHPDAGIRQLACEFGMRHERPEFADWLLPLLHDPQQSVQLAAIDAAGRCQNRILIEGLPGSESSEALPGLKTLLADQDSRISTAAAIAMSRLGHLLGHDELIRLCHHQDPQLRLQVITAMGTIGQTRFVKPLINLGWTARNVQIQLAALNSLEQLVPKDSHPPALQTAKSTQEKIQAWASWHEEKRRTQNASTRD